MTFENKHVLIVMFGLTFDLLLDTPRKTKMTMIPKQPTHFYAFFMFTPICGEMESNSVDEHIFQVETTNQ